MTFEELVKLSKKWEPEVIAVVFAECIDCKEEEFIECEKMTVCDKF